MSLPPLTQALPQLDRGHAENKIFMQSRLSRASRDTTVNDNCINAKEIPPSISLAKNFVLPVALVNMFKNNRFTIKKLFLKHLS
jgi:hypothetical protein